MTDQPNPYAPFKPPFRYDEDRGVILDSTRTWFLDINTLNYGQRIVDLLNRDAAQEQQPKPEHPAKEVK